MPEVKREMMTNEEIYQKVLDLWGINSQMIKMIEEMSELTTELCHELYDRGSVEAIMEELADVEIMLSQMKIIFPSTEAIKKKKLERLQAKIDKRTDSFPDLLGDIAARR